MTQFHSHFLEGLRRVYEKLKINIGKCAVWKWATYLAHNSIPTNLGGYENGRWYVHYSINQVAIVYTG